MHTGTYRCDGKLMAAGGELGMVQIFNLGDRGIVRTPPYYMYDETPELTCDDATRRRLQRSSTSLSPRHA